MNRPTLYQINQIKNCILYLLFTFFLLIISGNIISYFFFKKITIDSRSYILKNGFPLFVSEKAYIDFIKNYPYDPGVKFTFYNTTPGETLWGLRKKFNISIDTIISANPHLKGLELKNYDILVIPSKDGVLFTFDDYRDVIRMHQMMGNKNRILGDYKPKLFRIFSPDDIRLVFFENERPLIVNNDIQKIYAYKMTFSDPVTTGFYTSMFGDRVFGDGVEFHNGVDIATKSGTPIRSARTGIVFSAGWREGFGNTVIVQHDDGYSTFYGHCLKIFVKEGQWVDQNEVIASVGSTGRSTGSHLHYTVIRHGKLLNPLKYLW